MPTVTGTTTDSCTVVLNEVIAKMGTGYYTPPNAKERNEANFSSQQRYPLRYPGLPTLVHN